MPPESADHAIVQLVVETGVAVKAEVPEAGPLTPDSAAVVIVAEPDATLVNEAVMLSEASARQVNRHRNPITSTRGIGSAHPPVGKGPAFAGGPSGRLSAAARTG